MGKKFWSFILDIWRDGNVVLGAVAAPLSIAFTLAKAFDVEALGHLREISYAWALAPLTLWFFVAYMRRARTNISARKQDLQNFYVAAGPIITREIPKDISDDDFQAYVAEANHWVNTCASYINQEMGPAGRERFLDKTDMVAAHYIGAANKQHSNVVRNLSRFRKNLRLMIEGGAWD